MVAGWIEMVYMDYSMEPMLKLISIITEDNNTSKINWNRIRQSINCHILFKPFQLLATILLALGIFAAALTCAALGQNVISVEPALLATAPNDGSGIVRVSWEYPYNAVRVLDYKLVISRLDNGIVTSQTYSVGDAEKGQKSPLKGSYIWKVPRGQTEGMYQANLQITTKEAGIEEGGVYWRFGIAAHQGTLKIFKFEDLNGNGLQDPGENGLTGCKFLIETPNNDSYSYTTGGDGWVTIPKVAAGTYKITEIGKQGYRPTTEASQELNVPKDGEGKAEFGDQPIPPTLNIVKFHDLNRNGNQEPGEPGLKGWNFSVQGPVSFTATTDSEGKITREVRPGSYMITEIPSAVEDWIATTEREQTISLEQGVAKEVRFGNYRVPSAILKIVKFEDEDRNGIQASGEAGISDWYFNVTGQASFTAKTGADGTIVREVKAGTYTIREAPRQGWISTNGAEKRLSLDPGKEEAVAFGNTGPQYITKFHDLNANGKRDADEPGLAGWRFELKGPVSTTRTIDAKGEINLNDLPAGTYEVTEAAGDATWYNTTSASLSIKVPGPDIAFGNDKYRALEVFKFNDLNKNGKYDQSEPDLAGWEFQVSSNGQIEQNITDYRGIATFKVRANTTYTVSESLLAGWLNSTPLESEIWIDPKLNKTEAIFGDYIQPPTEAISTILKIIAFNDTNHNGERDPGEEGLSDWKFGIFNINETFGGFEFVTDDNGTIEYSCPIEGTYKVEELLPYPWCASTPVFLEKGVKAGGRETIEFGAYLCGRANCEYRYKPIKGNLTTTVEDENLIVRKSIDPYVLSMADHDMRNGSAIRYTISICAKPKLGPTDLVLAIDTSGSVIESNKGALTEISRGISGFISSLNKPPDSNLRIGLVSWDRDIDDLVPPTSDYSAIINASGKLRANSQELTMYHVGMNGSLEAFDAVPRQDARKVIVFITDARNEYEPFFGNPNTAKYTIDVLLMGRPQVEETYNMLNDTARRSQGRLLAVNSSAEITSALLMLTRTSLVANGSINDIKVVDTLPAYMRPMTTGTIPERLTTNRGVQWNTTTLEWSIPYLQYGRCWGTAFNAVFCWRLQANVVQPSDSSKATSQVAYADPAKGVSRFLDLPEGTIWLEADSGGGTATPTGFAKRIPGFEIFLGLGGLAGAAWLSCRKPARKEFDGGAEGCEIISGLRKE